MHDHVRLFPITLPQQILHLRGLVMCFFQRDVAIHQNMQFDGIVIANPSGTQIVRFHHIWQGGHQTKNLILYYIG